MIEHIVYSVSDFVAVFNQTINYAYPRVVIVGELSNFRLSKNKWVYFDLKDEDSTVRFFGTIYQLPGPVEDGMMVRVSGVPVLHPQFGFSVTVQSLELAGEGTLKRAEQLLKEKLTKEGVFDLSKKRTLPYPPQSIGLIASYESAAYGDFIKVLSARWGDVEILHYDVLVQGEQAPGQIKSALEYFNSHPSPPDVIVVTRGGGSTEDLQAFNTEQVVRAIAGCRIPTLIAIGHERDDSLAEQAADVRASTPSNAAELLVPDRSSLIAKLDDQLSSLQKNTTAFIKQALEHLDVAFDAISQKAGHSLSHAEEMVKLRQQVLNSLNPKNVLGRGYSIVRADGKSIREVSSLPGGTKIDIELYDGHVGAKVQ